MKKILIPILTLAVLSPFVACDNDDDNTPGNRDAGTRTDAGTNVDAGNTDGGQGDGGTQMPPPPTLGTQIDRVGRPAVNTALTGTFNPDSAAAGNMKDMYNSASDPANWSTFTAEIAANLAIYDGLDGNCGNQLLAAPDAGEDRYAALAMVLTDDRLYVNTDSTTCTQYLGVEANFIGVTNTDCGGRTFDMDVIDVTYSALAIGALTGVTDGVDEDEDAASSNTFPFVGQP